MDKELINLIAELTFLPYPLPTQKKETFIRRGNEKVVLDAFAHVLTSNDDLTKKKVVNDILSRIETEPAYNLLFYALHDPDWHLRHKALDVLNRKGFNSLPYVEGWLNRTDLSPWVRGGLLSILANHQRLKNTNDFIQILHYGDVDSRRYAVVHLEKIKTREVYDALSVAAIHEIRSDDIRTQILDIIKQFRNLNPDFSANENSGFFSSLLNAKDWFYDIALYFRRLGFFQDYKNKADDEFVLALKDLHSGQPNNRLSRMLDIQKVLFADKKRVWFRDAETYHKKEYVKILKEWADISCGKFIPRNISETWYSDKGPIQIEFEQGEQTFRANANYYGDWIDLGIIPQVNEAFKDSGVQFCNLIIDSQEICILSLTASQKSDLEKDLGFEFEFIGRYSQMPVFS